MLAFPEQKLTFPSTVNQEIGAFQLKVELHLSEQCEPGTQKNALRSPTKHKCIWDKVNKKDGNPSETQQANKRANTEMLKQQDQLTDTIL